MRPKIIAAATTLQPNLVTDAAMIRNFSWQSVETELGLRPNGVWNIGQAAVDRHAQGPRAKQIALKWLGKKGEREAFTYRELRALTNRFGNVLKDLNIKRGERVFLLTGRVPALYIAVLGALKNGHVVSPLFSAFGPTPLLNRLQQGECKLLVTSESLYSKKIAPIRKQLSSLKHVLLIGEGQRPTQVPDTLDFRTLLAQASEDFEVAPTGPDDMALLHFTSGTTGTPKGAVHVHRAVLSHYMTGKYALDLHANDLFWCTADPGWVTGTSYGILSPLLHGVASLVDESDFDADRWYRVLQDERVSVWYTAPTAIRMMMKAGAALAHQYRFPSLRFIASVGEPLNPEAVWWGQETLGLPIHDNWWQTETGGIMIANTPAMDIKPGSMGKPLPGIEAFIVRRGPSGEANIITEANVEGELAIKKGWPSMFRAYLHQDERYNSCFSGDLYLTGDLAKKDADGYFWFVGRADDVIKSAGHLIGPFEVENALMEHPAVAEAGVIGKPDPMVGESVKAFISLKSGFEANESLRAEITALARTRLGAAIAPKEIVFVASLPRTRSGKVMRRLLKARELGLPEGDISTLEAAP